MRWLFLSDQQSNGKEGEEALAVLLDGRSYEELQKEISKAWSRRGIDVTFAEEGEFEFPEEDEDY